MAQPFRRRIRNINKELQFYVKLESKFRIGIPYELYTQSNLIKLYGLPKDFISGQKSTPLAKGSVSKANLNGKFKRKQPPEKTVITRHISYIRKRDGHQIEFDRDYNVFVKELVHKFQVGFNFVINHNDEKIVVSDELTYNENVNSIVKNTHIANLFNEIFGEFEIYTEQLMPAIHFNKRFDKVILPSGELSNEYNFESLVEIGNNLINNEEHKRKFKDRLKIINQFTPKIIGKGPNGFNGYIAFEFPDLGIVILECILFGNATYIFKIENFEAEIFLDKQTVRKNKNYLKILNHNDNWRREIINFLNQQHKKCL